MGPEQAPAAEGTELPTIKVTAPKPSPKPKQAKEAQARPTQARPAAQPTAPSPAPSPYETGAPNTIDPLAGSYYIESLTNEIEERAMLYLEKIEAMGGTLRAIELGYVQQEIQNAAYDFQQATDRLETVVVGVNRFQAEREKPIPVQRIDEALEQKQVDRLRALRSKRDQSAWESAIRKVEEAARSGNNLMPHIIHAVESYCTVGEISEALRRVFGEYQEAVVI